MGDIVEGFFCRFGWILIWIILFILGIIASALRIYLQIKHLLRHAENKENKKKSKYNNYGMSNKEEIELIVLSNNKETRLPISGTDERKHIVAEI